MYIARHYCIWLVLHNIYYTYCSILWSLYFSQYTVIQRTIVQLYRTSVLYFTSYDLVHINVTDRVHRASKITSNTSFHDKMQRLVPIPSVQMWQKDNCLQNVRRFWNVRELVVLLTTNISWLNARLNCIVIGSAPLRTGRMRGLYPLSSNRFRTSSPSSSLPNPSGKIKRNNTMGMIGHLWNIWVSLVSFS